jgi:hypothetical protein
MNKISKTILKPKTEISNTNSNMTIFKNKLEVIRNMKIRIFNKVKIKTKSKLE